MTQDQSNEQAGQNDAEYQLSDADRAAVDAFFEGDQAADERAIRVQRLMGLLDTPLSDDGQRDTRITVTELRGMKQNDLGLSVASASSVDDWMDGLDPMTERDSVHAQMAGMVASGS